MSKMWWGVVSLVLMSFFSMPMSVSTKEVRDESLDNYVRLVINNFFASLATGIPDLGIPPLDPLKVGSITIPTLTVPGGKVDASVRDTAVNNLSKLTLTSLHLDLSMLRMDLRSIMPYLEVAGGYSLNGIFLNIFPLYGDGLYSVGIYDVVMLGGGALALDDTGHIQLTSLQMDANFTTLSVKFENLLGGGDFGETLNGILSNLGKSIFDQVKPFVIDALTSGIIKVVNDALALLPPLEGTKGDLKTGQPVQLIAE